MSFRTISPLEMQDNPFKLMGKDWMLMTAKKGDKINTMTVGWGGFGELWKKPVVFVAVRPERYTFEFVEHAPTFSLTAFDASFRKKLGICGTVSGRDKDKVAECGFTVAYDGDTPYFEEARLSMTCKKLANPQLRREDFLGDDAFASKWYSDGGTDIASGQGGGYHYLYIAEITNLLVREA